jgi:hypothetical protein
VQAKCRDGLSIRRTGNSLGRRIVHRMLRPMIIERILLQILISWLDSGLVIARILSKLRLNINKPAADFLGCQPFDPRCCLGFLYRVCLSFFCEEI